VPLHQVLDGLAQRAGAFAVDDPHEGQPGHIGRVQVVLHAGQRILNARPAQVKLQPR